MSDGRLEKGTRARRRIARRAVDIASLEGLTGLSFGRLAADLGLSKGGVQTLFGTKENLQLAAIESAGEAIAAAVGAPAEAAPRGVRRLRVMVDSWLVYASTPLFEGGCFWAANLPEFDSRPGVVRDALVAQHEAWVGAIADELRHAMEIGEIASLDVELVAFQMDAVLRAANTALRLGQDDVVDKVRRVINGFLGATGG